MTDLISLECYKEYKNIKSTESDGKIQSIITRISSLVEHYCNRKFVDYFSADNIEWFDGKTDSVTVTQFPLNSVTTVKTSEDGGVTQVTLVEAASDKGGYFVDTLNDKVLSQKKGFKFIDAYDTPFRSLEIAYRSGYDVDALPGDLQLCILDLVHYYKADENAPTKSLLGASIDNPQPYIANSFPPAIRRILDLYRYSS